MLGRKRVKGQDVHDPSTADAESVPTGDQYLGGVEAAQGQVVPVHQPQRGRELHHVVPNQLFGERC